VGFLGGYTTFSTLSYETFALARRGDMLYAWVNVGVSLLAGALAAGLGMALGLRIG
jgi:CrcB protein